MSSEKSAGSSAAALHEQRLRMRATAASADAAAEDDLLAQQRRFLQSHQPPAATITRATRADNHHSLKPVTFASSANTAAADDDDDEDEPAAPFPPAGQPVAQPRMIAAVLSDIVERDVSTSAVSSPSPQSIPLGSVHRGFPSTFKLRRSAAASPHATPAVKKSLFAQQREAMAARPQPQAAPAPPSPPAAGAEVRPRPEDGAASADLSAELSGIQAENEQKLAAMTADEIRDAQEELRAQLSPATLALLTRRGVSGAVSSRQPQARAQPSATASIDRLFGQQQDEDAEDDEDAGAVGQEEKEAEERMERGEEKDEQEAVASSLPPSPYHADPRTAWMEPLPYASSPPPWPTLTWDTGIAPPSSSSSSSSSAPPPRPVVGTAWSYWRVDFKGEFLPVSSSLASSSDRYDGLWHHGDQPQLAGYSMQELLLLSRSALPSQRVTALSTLASVLSCLHARAYTAPPLSTLRADINDVVLEHLLALGLCSALRVAMDDTVIGVVAAAVRGVEAVLARPDEEQRRDALAAAHNGHLYPAPALSLGAVAAHESPYTPAALDVSALEAAGASGGGDNEQHEQLCMKDVVAGLVQMQLLPRLRFLLHLHTAPTSPSSSAALVSSILHILLAVAQHSSAAASAVHSTPHMQPLLSSMVQSDPTSAAGPTSPHLLPLLAVLSSSSASVVQALSASSALLYSHHHLLVCNGLPGQLRPPVSVAALSLSCASLRLWRVALGYGKDAGSWLVFFPVIMQVLVAWPATGGRAKEQGSDEERQRADLLQVRQCYNVLEGLCWCVDRAHGKDDEEEEAAGEEDRAISATHLANSGSHALRQLASTLRAPLPHSSSPPLQTEYLSCLAGMAHFVASYYTARPAHSSTPAEVTQHWRDVLSALHHSPAVQRCVAALSTSPPSLSSSFFCFPSAAMSSPALHETDLLLGLCRWLHALLLLDAAAASALPSLLAQSPLLPFLLSVLSALAALPTLDAHTALLGYYIVLIALEAAPFASPSLWYRPAVLVVPPLLSCGYRQEALQLMRRAVLSSSALLALTTEREMTWTQRGADKLCPRCEWKARDMTVPAAMRATLLPMYEALMQAGDDGGPAAAISSHLLSVQSLALPPSSSPLAVYGAATTATWLLLPLRSGLFLSSSSSSSRPQSDRIALARAYLQYVSLLLGSSSLLLPPPAVDLSVAVRAVMDVFTLGPVYYTDPSLTPTLTHLTHVLLSPGSAGSTFSTAALNGARGWGWNFFVFFQALVERYVGEGLGDAAFASFMLLLLRRRHAADYRLLLLSSLAHCDVVEEDGVVVAWEECLWPREDCAEVLRAYKEWIIRQAAVRAGGGDEALGVVSVVAMHHLLCDWLGEGVVRAGWQDGDQAVRDKVRAKLGGAAADDGVVHALCRYRYTAHR